MASRQYFLAACKHTICASVSLGNVLVLGGGLSTGNAKGSWKHYSKKMFMQIKNKHNEESSHTTTQTCIQNYADNEYMRTNNFLLGRSSCASEWTRPVGLRCVSIHTHTTHTNINTFHANIFRHLSHVSL